MCRYLRDEILADVGAKYNIRKDAYSRAITGLSSGGICSFNAAWQMPDQFSRVISWIGSLCERSSGRKIRRFLMEGRIIRRKCCANRSEIFGCGCRMVRATWRLRYGSWPLANIRMANALKQGKYDFHLSFGKGSHNSAHGAAEFPEEMIWLWRDYDREKTEQVL